MTEKMTETSGSNGSKVTLREYFEAEIEWIKKHFQSKLDVIEKTAVKDEDIREVLRYEISVSTEKLESRVKTLELAKANLDGRSAMISMGVSFLIGLAFNYFTK